MLINGSECRLGTKMVELQLPKTEGFTHHAVWIVVEDEATWRLKQVQILFPVLHLLIVHRGEQTHRQNVYIAVCC